MSAGGSAEGPSHGMDAVEAVDRFYGTIYRFAYRMLQERETAEDVSQEVFLRLAAGAPHMNAEATRRWLFVVARNLCLSELRRASVRARSLREIAGEGPAPIRSPSSQATADEVGEQIAKVIAGLEPEFREVVVLREYEGLDYAEIAAILGCAEGTVKSRLARARERLREGLRPYWESQR